MRLETETRVRFVTQPIAYLCRIDPDYEEYDAKRGYRKIISISSDLDKFYLARGQISIRSRALVFNCNSKLPEIFDFGEAMQHTLQAIMHSEDWGDLRGFDLQFRPEKGYDPGRMSVIPRFCKQANGTFTRQNNEPDKFVYDCDKFISDSRAGKFAFDLVPSWVLWSETTPPKDGAIDVTDGSQYASLKAEIPKDVK